MFLEMSGIVKVNSGPLLMRTYNTIQNGKDYNTYVYGQNETVISSNYLLITSTGGALAPTDNVVVSSITLSSLATQNATASTLNVSTLTTGAESVSSQVVSTSQVSLMNFSTLSGSTLTTVNATITGALLGNLQVTSASMTNLSTVTFTASNQINTPTLNVSTLNLPVHTSGTTGYIQGGTNSQITMTSAVFNTLTVPKIGGSSITLSTITCGSNSFLTLSSITVSSINGVTPIGGPVFYFGSTINVSSLMVQPGNMGIGTTVPGATLLHAYNPKPTYTTLPTVQISDGCSDTTGTYGMLQLVRPSTVTDSKGYLSFVCSSLNTMHMGFYSNPSTFGFTMGPGAMTASTLMSFSGTNVGIGNSAPVESLHVTGKTLTSLAYSQVCAYNNLAPTINTNTWYKLASFTGTVDAELILIWNAAGSPADRGTVRFTVAASYGQQSRIFIHTSTYYNGPAIQQLRIANDPNNPANTCFLEFFTNTTFSGTLSLTCYVVNASPLSNAFSLLPTLNSATINFTYYTVNVATAFSVESNGAILCMQPSGNVGIGTASPNFNLDVTGTGRCTTSFQTGAVNLVGTTNNSVYCGNVDAYNPTGTNDLMIQSAWGIGFQSGDTTVRAAIDTKTGNASFNGIVTATGGFKTTGSVIVSPNTFYVNSANNSYFNMYYWTGGGYLSTSSNTTIGNCYYFLPYTLQGKYWNTYTVQSSPVIETASTVYWKMNQNGIYSITLTMYCPSGTELFLSRNLGNGYEVSTTVGSGHILAFQTAAASNATVSWTGYVATTDNLCIGFYSPSVFSVATNTQPNAVQNSISVTLVQATT